MYVSMYIYIYIYTYIHTYNKYPFSRCRSGGRQAGRLPSRCGPSLRYKETLYVFKKVIHVCIYIYIYIYIYIHTYIHTYIYIYIYIVYIENFICKCGRARGRPERGAGRAPGAGGIRRTRSLRRLQIGLLV